MYGKRKKRPYAMSYLEKEDRNREENFEVSRQ